MTPDDLDRNHYEYSLPMNVYYQIEFVTQWLLRLASKRNVVVTDHIVGKIFFFHFENLACFAVSCSSIIHQAKFPVYQVNDIQPFL